MKLIEAQNELAIRLYEWSQRDLVRELDEGCPLLSLVGLNNRFVAGFVEWVETLSHADRATLARELVRRGHENAANLRKEAVSRSERKCFNEEFYEHVASRERLLPPLYTADERLPSFKPVDPNQCLGIVFESLSPVLGKPTRRRLEVATTRVFGDWKLVTEFWFHKPDRFLFCEYHIGRKDGKMVTDKYGPFPTNLFLFYGISDTFVVVPSQADSEPMAKAMAKLAEHFVAQADPLFAGLGIDD